jgi:hypothetical protein
MCNDYINLPFVTLASKLEIGVEFKQKHPRLILSVELYQGVDLWFLKGKQL